MATVLNPVSRGVCQGVAAVVLALAVWAGPSARAGMLGIDGPVGSQGFTDFGVATARSGDVRTSPSYTIGNLVSTASSYGFFTGLPPQDFGSVTFTVADPYSLQFGNAVFGWFASTSIRQLSNDPLVGSRSFFMEGTFTKGTFGGPLVPNPALANFTVSFNQTGGTETSISNNATLDFPVQPVPEPATLALLVGAALTAIVARRR